MTLPAKGSKVPEASKMMDAINDKRSRLVTIESWLTINGYLRESYNRRQLCELIDEFEQLVNREQKRLNDHMMKLVEDFNNCTPRPIFMAIDPAWPWKKKSLWKRLQEAISRRYNAMKGRH